LHIECDPVPDPGHIIGKISCSDTSGLKVAISNKNGLPPEMYNELFRNGKFLLDGDEAFEQVLLQKLGLNAGFQIASGYYPYTIKNDTMIIVFK
jgi:hypothetical protein